MKKIIVITSILMIMVTVIPVRAATDEPQKETSVVIEKTLKEQSIEPRADVIEWRYKVENGKTYKRLYNYTKKQWIGDWILA